MKKRWLLPRVLRAGDQEGIWRGLASQALPQRQVNSTPHTPRRHLLSDESFEVEYCKDKPVLKSTAAVVMVGRGRGRGQNSQDKLRWESIRNWLIFAQNCRTDTLQVGSEISACFLGQHCTQAWLRSMVEAQPCWAEARAKGSTCQLWAEAKGKFVFQVSNLSTCHLSYTHPPDLDWGRDPNPDLRASLNLNCVFSAGASS